MKDAQPLDLLETCVREIREGRRSLPECLAQYPEHRAELEALVPIALAITTPPVQVDPGRKRLARQRFIEALYQESRGSWWEQFWAALGPSYRLFRVGVAMACTLLVLASAAVGAVVAAQEAKPGDLLYGVRLAVEDMQVAVAGPPEARARVRLAIATQHLWDIERALERQDEDSARRAAAAYQEALDRARADVEQARTSPAAASEIEQLIDTTRRRQEWLALRARERGQVVTEATLEQAKERLIARPDSVTRPAPTEAPPPRPGAPQSTSTTEPTAIPTATSEPSPSPALAARPETVSTVGAAPPAAATEPRGTVRGVIGPPAAIAQARPIGPELAPPPPPPTPTPIGVRGIPAAEPRGPILLPTAPTAGNGSPERNGADGPSAPRASATPIPLETIGPAIAMEPRGQASPAPASGGGAPHPGDARPSAPRPEEPRPGSEQAAVDPDRERGPRAPTDPRWSGPVAMPPALGPSGTGPSVLPVQVGPTIVPPTEGPPVPIVPPTEGPPVPAVAAVAAPPATPPHPTPRPAPTATPTPTAVILPTAVPTVQVLPTARARSGQPEDSGGHGGGAVERPPSDPGVGPPAGAGQGRSDR